MHRFGGFMALSSAAHIRLVSYDDQKKAGRFQVRASFGCSRIKLELLDRRRRKWKAVAHYRAIENAVSIEKNGAPFYFVLSHFVCAAFSAG